MDIPPECDADGVIIAIQNLRTAPKTNSCGPRSNREPSLDSVSLVALPGKVTAIIGASGAGRTALLSAIAGRNKDVHAFRLTGQIDVEQQPIALPANPIARMSFVDWADDHFLPHLTVEETVTLAADLRLFGSATGTRRSAVDSVLTAMGLEWCRNTRVGDLGRRGISTGERRRLVIALELLDLQKQVLLLNRPTTGLDSACARRVIETLSGIAKAQGRTIITALDQPSSAVLNACDSVALMHGGRLLFQGLPGDLVEFLQKQTATVKLPDGYGASDFVFDIIDSLNEEDTSSNADTANKLCAEHLQEAFQNSPQAYEIDDLLSALLKKKQMPNNGPRVVPVRLSAAAPAVAGTSNTFQKLLLLLWTFGSSVKTLCKRSWLNTSRTSLVWAPLVVALIQGILMGFIMFRYDRWLPTPDADMAPIIPPGILEGPVYEVLKSGVAMDEFGKPIRPLLNVLSDGIDGHGNNWIIDVINYSKEVPDNVVPRQMAAIGLGESLRRILRVEEHYAILYLRNIARCTRKKWKLDELGFPPVEIENSDGDDDTSNEAFNPEELASDLMNIMQMLDYLWNRLDWTEASQCDQDDWLCLAQKAGGLAEDMLTCGGFQPLPTALGGIITLAGRPPVIPFPPEPSATRRRLDVEKVIDVLQILRDYVKADTNRYDGDLSEIQQEISAKYWRRFFEITESLVPGWTLPELVALLLSPETHGDLSTLPNRDGMDTLVSQAKEMWHWLNSEKQVALGGPFNQRPETTGVCKNEFCQLVKLSLVRAVRRLVNRLKIEAVLRLFPRLVVNAWNALTATGALFAMMAALAFFCVDVLLSFASMRSMMNRETFNGLYSPGALFLARNLVDLPNQILPAFLLAMVWGLMSQVVVGAAQVFTLIGISIALLFATYGLCYLASAVTPRLEVAMVLAPLALMSWVIVSGFIMRDTELLPAWTRWFRHISFHRFGWFGAMINSFPADKLWGELPGSTILWIMGVPENAKVGTQVVRLIILGVVTRVAACLAFYCFYRGAGITAESKTDE